MFRGRRRPADGVCEPPEGPPLGSDPERLRGWDGDVAMTCPSLHASEQAGPAALLLPNY